MAVGDDAQQHLDEIRDKEAEDLAKLLSAKYKLPYIDLTRITIELDSLKLIPEDTARANNIVAFRRVGENIQVAIQSPNPEGTKQAIKAIEEKGAPVTLYLASENSIAHAIEKYSEVSKYKTATRGIIDISIEKVEESMQSAKSFDGLEKLFNTMITGPGKHRVSEMLEVIIGGAISIRASDVHLEPQQESVRLRLRVDGVLHDILSLPNDMYNLLLSRIKLVSGLKLNIHNQAQDGRLSIKLENTDIEMRTSVIPESYGESIVLRILNPKTIAVPFEELGIEPKLLELLLREIGRPNGMILTTGPTGSGKTTTLYAFLKKKQSPDIKIITLEDPVEYHLKGVVQTQVDDGGKYTFASGLRSILRQDPDVIMIGEIRDNDTAEIAANAALTGHLVLSTLHTNDAAGTIPRLLDLGVNPAALSPALNAIMAQRLVRRLCSQCKKVAAPNAEATKKISHITDGIPNEYRKDIPKKYILYEAGDDSCGECNGIGYKGRIGVYEVIIATDDVKQLILSGEPNQLQIKELADKQGMLTLAEDGILKVLQGITSLDELERVIEL